MTFIEEFYTVHSPRAGVDLFAVGSGVIREAHNTARSDL